MIDLNTVSCLENTTAPAIQHIPPIIIVLLMLINSAKVPAIRLPSGAIPMKATVKKLITRPRLSLSTNVCSMVLQDATRTMTPKPITTINIKENHVEWEIAKPISPTPNIPAESGIILPRPSIDFLAAS